MPAPNTACFFDTNVIVYAYDSAAPAKQDRARALLAEHARAGTLVVSTQVLQESYVTLVRKGLLEPAHALQVLEALSTGTVVGADAPFVLRGLRLAQQHQLSPWDGLVVQAAIDGRCTTLLSEDLSAGQRFGEMEVVNPFRLSAHGPRAAWRSASANGPKRPIRR